MNGSSHTKTANYGSRRRVAKDLSWLTGIYRPDVLIDIGANDGAYGGFLQKQFGVSIVHAFEPLSQHGAELLGRGRSGEHTSELQSLMRISYAVFCLQHKSLN